jgi:hypothetical protein
MNIKGNHYQNKETTKKMGGNLCKLFIGQNPGYINSLKIQHQKNKESN